MKSRDEEWGPGPDFGPPPHPGEKMTIEEQAPPEDEPMSFRLLRRIEYTGRIHHMAFRSILQEDGLPPAQASALRFIIRFPGMSQRELADRLHIQRATVTVMLQKMDDKRNAQGFQRLCERMSGRGILAAFPFAICGFFRYNGMYFEQFAWAFLCSELLYPRQLVYKSENLYAKALADSSMKEVLTLD